MTFFERAIIATLERIEVTLRHMERTLKGRKTLNFVLEPFPLSQQLKITGGIIMFQMTNDSKGAQLSLTLTDAKGQPAVAAAPPVWTESSAGAILALTVSADGLTATILPVSVGSAQVNVTVEGDPVPGVDTRTGTLDVTVVGGEVANVVINAVPIS